ncbi:type II secretion system protein [Luteolibacter sp. LG18]|uniref:type II secretion system protein n=1 Tax=Luteolibacter sp. LG18 TaxID=2819286 RepID=UPI002B309F7C|nr:hypothetical protein llg_37470 [Luteolibacter sp. LG18]
MISSLHKRARKGFLMLEVVLALAIFGTAAVAFVVAISRMSATAQYAQSKLRITRILESALDEALAAPTMEEGTTTTVLAEADTEVVTKVEAMQDQLQNEDGQALQEMYLITVIARWTENNQEQEQSARVWRYSRMYQP